MAGVGILVGSAARVEVFRSSVPAGSPRQAACPRCACELVHPGRLWHSWAVLCRGTCRSCGSRIGPPLAAVELATAFPFAALTLCVDALVPLLVYCFVAAVGVTLTFVDLAVHRLPDRLTITLATGVVAAFGITSLADGERMALLEGLVSGLGVALVYVLMWLVTSGGISLGDAKLALGLGVVVGWSGWRSAVFAVVLGLVLTGLAAVVLLSAGRASRNDPIPHGPFMILAALTTVSAIHTW
ncbi:prepilin peptidase [Dactylosporangium sucinum]|nr:A24 family peptidase [Dactylosporangium sucinum]